MSLGKNEFQNRIARIKENTKQPTVQAGPALPKEHMADLATLRCNTESESLKDILKGIWSVPTFRYALPVVLAVLSYAPVSALFPDSTDNLIVAEARHSGVTGQITQIFNTEKFAQFQYTLMASLGAVDAQPE